MNTGSRAALWLAASICLSLGGASLGGAAPAAPKTPPRACFWIRNVDSFASVDSSTVYVRARMRDVFQLKLFSPCIGVDWSHHIGLRSRSGSHVCEGTANSLEIQARSMAGRQRCQVQSVRKLTPEEIAALPKGARP